MEDTPPELAADIIDKGIIMSGGTANLRNLDKFIAEEGGSPAIMNIWRTMRNGRTGFRH